MIRRLASKVPYVRIIGLVLVIGVGIGAYEVSRSPIIGVLGVIGAVVAGLSKRHPKGSSITILALVAALAAGSVPQAAHANGGTPRWYLKDVPAGCKAQGNPEPDRYGAWWIDPAYKSCQHDGSDLVTRCAAGAVGFPIGSAGAWAMTAKSVPQWAARVGEITPWGLLIGASTGCLLVLIKP